MTIRKVKKLLRAYAQKTFEQYKNDEKLAKLLAYQAQMKVKIAQNKGYGVPVSLQSRFFTLVS